MLTFIFSLSLSRKLLLCMEFSIGWSWLSGASGVSAPWQKVYVSYSSFSFLPFMELAKVSAVKGGLRHVSSWKKVSVSFIFSSNEGNSNFFMLGVTWHVLLNYFLLLSFRLLLHYSHFVSLHVP
jgi:hypothetical protein